MNNLSLRAFAAVDVGDALAAERDSLARQRDLPLLHTDLVSQVRPHADELVAKPNLSPLAIEATCSHTGRTCSQPTSRASIGCMVVTSPLCAQTALMGPASPLVILFNAA
jgi:hypothetical protein